MMDLEARARELAEQLPDQVVTVFAIGDDTADVSIPNAEQILLAFALSVAADAREEALREAIEAVREGYDPDFKTIAEDVIRALLRAEPRDE